MLVAVAMPLTGKNKEGLQRELYPFFIWGWAALSAYGAALLGGHRPTRRER